MSLDDLRRRAQRAVNLNPKCCRCGAALPGPVWGDDDTLCERCEDELLAELVEKMRKRKEQKP